MKNILKTITMLITLTMLTFLITKLAHAEEQMNSCDRFKEIIDNQNKIGTLWVVIGEDQYHLYITHPKESTSIPAITCDDEKKIIKVKYTNDYTRGVAYLFYENIQTIGYLIKE